MRWYGGRTLYWEGMLSLTDGSRLAFTVFFITIGCIWSTSLKIFRKLVLRFTFCAYVNCLHSWESREENPFVKARMGKPHSGRTNEKLFLNFRWRNPCIYVNWPLLNFIVGGSVELRGPEDGKLRLANFCNQNAFVCLSWGKQAVVSVAFMCRGRRGPHIASWCISSCCCGRVHSARANCLLSVQHCRAVTNLLLGSVVSAHPFLPHELRITSALPEYVLAILQ